MSKSIEIARAHVSIIDIQLEEQLIQTDPNTSETYVKEIRKNGIDSLEIAVVVWRRQNAAEASEMRSNFQENGIMTSTHPGSFDLYWVVTPGLEGRTRPQSLSGNLNLDQHSGPPG